MKNEQIYKLWEYLGKIFSKVKVMPINQKPLFKLKNGSVIKTLLSKSEVIRSNIKEWND